MQSKKQWRHQRLDFLFFDMLSVHPWIRAFVEEGWNMLLIP